MILGLVTLWMPNYEILPWHQWLCYAALNWVIVAMNVYGSKMVSILNQLTSKDIYIVVARHVIQRC